MRRGCVRTCLKQFTPFTRSLTQVYVVNEGPSNSLFGCSDWSSTGSFERANNRTQAISADAAALQSSSTLPSYH